MGNDTDIHIYCVLLLCSSVVPRGRAGLGPDYDPLAEGVEACLHDGGEWWAALLLMENSCSSLQLPLWTGSWWLERLVVGSRMLQATQQ
jgi:hypothetical protein